MRILILSRSESLYSTRRLLEAGEERGHTMVLVDVLAAVRQMNQPEVWQKGWFLGLLGKGDTAVGMGPAVAMVPRVGSSSPAEGVRVVRYLEERGVVTTATATALELVRDKQISLRVMQDAGLPIPLTRVVRRVGSLAEAAIGVGGFPCLIKLNHSTHGRGVLLIPNLATATAVWNIIHRRQKQILLQEFIKEARGRDWRL
ncbi:MAG TPA: hypothetical protein VLL52_24250, partial [Anaerolineae bacterium]|nr:hypothetical protein [Anaerolineae bacterium]